jgi:hypothetical protein
MKKYSIFLRSPSGGVSRYFAAGKNAATARKLFLEELRKRDPKKFVTHEIVGFELESEDRERSGGGANSGGGARAKKMTRLEELEASLPKGWIVRTWSPGDGVTRYRFFHNAPKGQTYYGPADGAYTALGMKEADAFAAGLAH